MPQSHKTGSQTHPIIIETPVRLKDLPIERHQPINNCHSEAIISTYLEIVTHLYICAIYILILC